MSMTLDELSNLYDIPAPTLNARLKQLEQKEPHKKLSFKEKNLIKITDDGIKLLEENLKEKPYKKKNFKKRTLKSTLKSDFKNTLKSNLKSDLKSKDDEKQQRKLLKKDKKIKKLHKTKMKQDLTIIELRAKIERLEAEISAKNVIIEGKEEIIRAKNETIAKSNDRIESLEQTNKMLLLNIDLKDKLQAQALGDSHELARAINNQGIIKYSAVDTSKEDETDTPANKEDITKLNDQGVASGDAPKQGTPKQGSPNQRAYSDLGENEAGINQEAGLRPKGIKGIISKFLNLF